MKITFFGLGAVGSVMAQCMHELHQRHSDDDDLRFVFVVRSIKEAKQNLFRFKDIAKFSKFIAVRDFKTIFDNPKRYQKQLVGSSVFVNSATPSFNQSIIKLALQFKTNYCDLASEIYNRETLQALQFPQQVFHEQLSKQNRFGLVNIGVSPGVTNFLVGEKMLELKSLARNASVLSIHLYLLEHIDTDQVIFSWSPKVALEELEEKPGLIQNRKLVSIKPFSFSQAYEFPHFDKPVREYPIYQEEMLSFFESYPQILNLQVSAGGSDVEVIKTLFQLNLLSKHSVEKIVREVLPGLQTPQQIETMVRQGIIKSAQFGAVAEITLSNKIRNKMTTIVESTGLSFNRYTELVNTPYSGATYISYPTGIGAAVLLFYCLKNWQKNQELFSGILKAEDLPEKMDGAYVNQIKQEMSAYKFDFFTHTHSFLKPQPRKGVINMAHCPVCNMDVDDMEKHKKEMANDPAHQGK